MTKEKKSNLTNTLEKLHDGQLVWVEASGAEGELRELERTIKTNGYAHYWENGKLYIQMPLRINGKLEVLTLK